MSKSDNLGDFLDDLAEGIKAKKGISYAINPQDFRSEIESIKTGGGGVVAEDSFYTIPTQYTIDRFDTDVIYDGKTCAQIQINTSPEIILPADATALNTYFYLEFNSLSINGLVLAVKLPTANLAGIKLSDIIFYIDDSSGYVTYGMGLPLGGSKDIVMSTQEYGLYDVSVYCNGRAISMRTYKDRSSSDVANNFITL